LWHTAKSTAMNRKHWLLAILLLTSFNLAEAQQSAKIREWPIWLAFRLAPMRPSGGFSASAARIWLYRRTEYSHRNPSRKPQSRRASSEDAAELVGRKPDVLVAVTTNAALAAKKAAGAIPVVFMGVTDPVTAGLVESIARPGANVTGVTNMVPST